MARVLLLNPPAPGRPVLRDFACGESTKADYYWAPIDLLVLSGVLAADHDLAVIDAVASGLDAHTAHQLARRFKPDVVFSLTAAVSLEHDDRFLTALARETGARIYGLGDVASFAPRETLMRTRAFDGLLTTFSDPALTRLAAGDDSSVGGITLRRGDSVEARPANPTAEMRYGLPRHQLFPLDRYRMPFTRWERCTSILTLNGCPFPCTFCASRNLPYQLRPLEDLAAELEYVRLLGVREVYFRDFTFGPTRKRAQELCRTLVAAGSELRWSAECRLDVLDEPTLDLMREAGCEVILVGIETGDDAVAKRLGKSVRAERTHRVLSHARSIGIRSCGHFVLGSPEETPAQVLATIRHARALPLDYAAFNLYAPRLGTTMRTDLVQLGRLQAEDFGDHDVSARANAYANMPAAELRRLFMWAVLSFYGRPSQLARLVGCTPWGTLARQGTGVLKGLLEARA